MFVFAFADGGLNADLAGVMPGMPVANVTLSRHPIQASLKCGFDEGNERPIRTSNTWGPALGVQGSHHRQRVWHGHVSVYLLRQVRRRERLLR
jgi:hypothetical protein